MSADSRLPRRDGLDAAVGVSRRQVLTGVATAGALMVGGTSTALAAKPPVVVMTRNLFVGADLFSLLNLSSSDDLQGVVADLLEDVEHSDVDRRLGAIVDEIAATRPHLVSLQEVALVRIRRAEETTRRFDFLRSLNAALRRRNLPYRVVSQVTNADVWVPAADRANGGRMTVRFTDRDVILARRGVHVRGSFDRRYAVAITAPLDENRQVTVHRGYCAVQAVVGGRDLLFVATHLETPLSEVVQLKQAVELVATLRMIPLPTVVAGDFNSPPGSPVYGLLTRDFTDAYAAARPGQSGATCCHSPGLLTPDSELTRRIDLVLTRGEVATVDAARVGTDPIGDDPAWASDHAGVVATLRVAPLRDEGIGSFAAVTRYVRRMTAPLESASRDVTRRLEATSHEVSSRLSAFDGFTEPDTT